MDQTKSSPSGFRLRFRERFSTRAATSWRRNHNFDVDDGDASPEPLPRFRPRAVSNERAFDESLDEATHYLVSKFPYTLQQDQSPLFTRLLFHVRQRILSFAVGCSTYHVRTQHAVRGPKLVSLDCVFPEHEGSFNSSVAHPCWRYSSRFAGKCAGDYSKLADFPDPPPISLLGLLTSCRRAYTESIDLLYSQSAFTFDRLQPFVDLSNTISTTRLNIIRRISISWSFGTMPASIRAAPTADYRRWQSVCSILAGMPDIRELVIFMKGDTGSQEQNSLWLEPLDHIVPRYTKTQVILSISPPSHHKVSEKCWDWHYRSFGHLIVDDDSTSTLQALSDIERQQVWEQIGAFSASQTLHA